MNTWTELIMRFVKFFRSFVQQAGIREELVELFLA